MSQASHIVGRLRKLYGIVYSRMRFMNEQSMNPSQQHSAAVFHSTVETLEPRMLFSSVLATTDAPDLLDTLAPANDNFSDRTVIDADGGTLTATNTGATQEEGEPESIGNGNSSVWWTWTPATNCVAQIDTFGSDFDTTLGVYTGSSVSDLTTVASNDDHGDGLTSLVWFDAVAGTPYQIAVDSFCIATGNITLDVTTVVAPANNSFSNSTAISADGGTLTGTNIGATKEAGEPDHGDDAGGSSVWWTWTPTKSGFVQVDTIGSNFDTALGVYTGSSVSELTAVASNDDYGWDCTNLVSFDAVAGTTYQIAVDGFYGDSGNITLNVAFVAPEVPTGVDASDGTYSDGIHVTWDPSPGATSYEVWRYASDDSAPFVRIAKNVMTTSYDDTSATEDVTYYYWVKAKNSGGASDFSDADSGYLAPVSPANDNFSNATAVSADGDTLTGTNINATKEAGEPHHGYNTGGSSVWWTWTPTASGMAQIDTIGSDFDTTLGVYTGSSVSDLTTVASDDDAGWGFTSLVTFDAVAGTTYQIAVDGYRGECGNITLDVTIVAVPANDNFSNATVISADGGTFTANNLLATKETGEPDHGGDSGGHSVWWTWTPTTSGMVQIDTFGSEFGTSLAVYTGTSFSDLTTVASNDPYGEGDTWRVTFNAVAGTTYQIAVDGYYGYTGNIALDVAFIVFPANDNFSNPTIIDADGGTLTGTNIFATKETGEPDHADDAGGSSVWWAWTPTTSGIARIDTFGSDFDTTLGVYTGSSVSDLTTVASNDQYGEGDTSLVRFNAVAGTTYQIAVDGYYGYTGDITLNVAFIAPPANDNFSNPTVIAADGGTLTATNTDATKETGEPAHGDDDGGSSVWWTWTPTTSGFVQIDTYGSDFNTALGVYTGSSVSDLTTVASSDLYGDYGLVYFNVVAGTTYQIAVDGYDGATGNITLNVALTAAPANDNFSNSTAISADGGTVTGTNVAASEETGEPVHGDDTGTSSVWWTWTPTQSGLAQIDTLGSDFYTTLDVYTGSSIAYLTTVPSNYQDDLDYPNLSFHVVAGTTYQIAVDGYDGEWGNVTLNVALTAAPANDNFSNRTAIDADGGTLTATNVAASKETGEPDHGDDAGGSSVWWTWTPTTNGVVQIDTFGSDFDTTLGVYTGSNLSHLITVASNDQNGWDDTSMVSFNVVAGKTYQIAVDGYEGSTGNITLNVDLTAVPANDNFSNRTVIDAEGGTLTGTNIIATKETGEPDHGDAPGGSSVWWTWTPTISGFAQIDTIGSNFDTTLSVYTGMSVSHLTTVASNDQYGDGNTSLVNFEVVAGTTYQIAVDGYDGDQGDITLDVAVVSASTPAAPTWVDASDGAYTDKVSLTWDSSQNATTYEIWRSTSSDSHSATRIAYHLRTTSYDDTSAEPNTTYYYWVRAKNASGLSFFGAADSGCLAPTAPANDNFSNPTAISADGGTLTGTNALATKETGEPDHGDNAGGSSVWWTWTPTTSGYVEINTLDSDFDTTLGVYTGSSISDLTTVASNDDSDWDTTSMVSFYAVAGTTYQIAVDGFDGEQGDITLDVTLIAAPANDNFSNSTAISADGGTLTGTNIFASKETGEPDHGDNAGGSSVWWTWTPTVSGTAWIDVSNSNFYATLGVYTGSSVSELTTVARNDGWWDSSWMSFYAVAGTTYQIAVDGFDGDQGDIMLDVAITPAPSNDSFSNPTVISTDGGTLTATNIDATKEAGEPDHGYDTGGCSVWWTWTPTTSGIAEIATFGSDFDTTLGVYTGSSVSDLTTVASNDEYGWESTSLVSFNVVAGTTYHIAVDGYDGESGNITLNWALTPAPANDSFSNRTAIGADGGTLTGTNIAAAKETGEPDHGDIGGSSVWWTWIPTISGIAKIDTVGSDFDTTLGVYTGSSVSDLTTVVTNDDYGDGLTSRVSFNVVAGTTYHIAVDGYDGDQGDITLNVIAPPNVSPTDITLGGDSVSENQPAETIVGTLSTIDPDAGDAFTYALVGGTGADDNAQFTISGNTLKTAANFNYEAKGSYTIRVRTTDQGKLSIEKVFVITVADVNEQPAISDQTFSLPENTAIGTLVDTVAANDPDAGQRLTYSFTAGNTNNAFAIDPSTGQITVADSSVLNYEAIPSFALTVQVIDNGTALLSKTATVTINLTNLNEQPAISDRTFSLPENTGNGTLMGTVAASDPDAGQSLTYSFTAGNTNNAFAINPSTGQITVADSSVLNYEAISSFALTVQVVDNGTPVLSKTATVIINLTDVNEQPTSISLSNTSFTSNQAPGAVIGTFTTDDQDVRNGNTFTYKLVDGAGSDDNDQLMIDGNSLKTTAAFVYGAKSSYTIRVQSTDPDGLTTEKVFVINATRRTVDLSAKSTAQWTDADGTTVTVSLHGAGTGTIYLPYDGWCDASSIILSGTTCTSSLTITTKGPGSGTSLGGIDTQGGSLGSINASTTDLQGNVRVGSSSNPNAAVSMTFDQIKNSSISTAMPLKSLTATEWLDDNGTPDILTAPSVGKLAITGKKANAKTGIPGIRGDFGADLVLTGAAMPAKKATLGSVNIAGDLLSGSQWDIRSGYIGSLTFNGTVDHSIIRSAGDIVSIKVGASNGSDFGAGVGFDLLQSDGHVAVGDAANAPRATIKTFTVAGWKLAKSQPIPRFFIDSNISAKTDKLNLLNWDEQGGLFAPAGSVKSIVYKDTADKTKNWAWPISPRQVSSGPEDFVHTV